MLRSANANVRITTTWPHKVVYDKSNKAAKFSNLTMQQFVHGYTKVSNRCSLDEIKVRNEVLEEIMEDADRYAWDLVRSAHKIFLQQVETGRLSWHDTSAR